MTEATTGQFCRQLLSTQDLAIKLALPPADLVDDDCQPADAAMLGRPPGLEIRSSRDVKVPPIHGIPDPSQRARILHALANHELQAAELFAWALLQFVDSPPAFRRGLLAILADEQRHCQMYIDRMADFGVAFGDYPVTGYFWHKLDDVDTPIRFVCAMALTFESANLDFAIEYEQALLQCDDEETAHILRKIHDDEIRHVRFGWRWLQEFKDSDVTSWEAYLENITPPLGPSRARGATFDIESRKSAGFDDEFIEELSQTLARRPSGRPR